MLNGKVLLVDDNDLVRLCVAELLTDCDIEVMVAASGSEALGLLDEHPAALLVDLNLGCEMDGRQLAEVVHQRCPETAVILMSGDAEALRLKSSSRDTMLAKPFSLTLLLATLSNATTA